MLFQSLCWLNHLFQSLCWLNHLFRCISSHLISRKKIKIKWKKRGEQTFFSPSLKVTVAVLRGGALETTAPPRGREGHTIGYNTTYVTVGHGWTRSRLRRTTPPSLQTPPHPTPQDTDAHTPRPTPRPVHTGTHGSPPPGRGAEGGLEGG